MIQIKLIKISNDTANTEFNINTELNKIQNKNCIISDIKITPTHFTIIYNDDFEISDEQRMKREAKASGGDFVGSFEIKPSSEQLPYELKIDDPPKFEELPGQLFIMRYYSGIGIDESHKFPKIFKDENMVRVTLSNDVFDKVSLIETLRSTFTKTDRGVTAHYTINKILTRGNDEIPGIGVASFYMNDLNVDSTFENIANTVAVMHQNYQKIRKD